MEDADEFIARDELPLEIRKGEVPEFDRRFRFSLPQKLHRRVVACLNKVEPDRDGAAPQGREQIARPAEAILQSDGKPQARRITMAALQRLGFRIRQQRPTDSGGIGENLAGRRERDGATAPRQQGDSEPPLRLFHLMGGGGLGQAQGARRRRQRSGAADRHHHCEVVPADLHHMKEINGYAWKYQFVVHLILGKDGWIH